MDLFNFLYQYLHLGLYSSLFIIILLEEAGLPLPVPGDAFIVIFGVLSRGNETEYLPTLLIVLAASGIGSSILYTVSYKYGRPLADRYGRYIHLTPSLLNRMERWMGKYGWIAIFVARMVPTLRIGGSIVAGTLKVPYPTFLAATLTATWLWVSIYFFLGAYLGQRYGPLLNSMLENHYFFLVLFVSFIVIGIIVFRLIIPAIERMQRQRDEASPKSKADRPL